MLPFASHEGHLLFAPHEARHAAQSVQSFRHREMWSDPRWWSGPRWWTDLLMAMAEFGIEH